MTHLYHKHHITTPLAYKTQKGGGNIVYSIQIPQYILDQLEEQDLDLDKEIHRAVSTGLRELEQTLKDAEPEPWQLYRYDEWNGKNKPWHGHTRHYTTKTTINLNFRLAAQAIRILALCNDNDIDPRTLYWNALIKPNIPHGADNKETKEMLQSNQLPAKRPSTIISLCLWRHALLHQNIPENQERLKGVA